MPRKIVQFGAPRTGTTVVFQVLRKVFPDDKVEKNHDWKPRYKDYDVVGTYRDPRDVAVSYWRSHFDISPEQIKRGRRMSRAEAAKWATFSKQVCQGYKAYLKNRMGHKHMTFLRYESFYENFDWLFKRLEAFFEIEIDDETKNMIRITCSKEANLKVAARMKTFKKWDRTTYIHGNHIYKGTHGSWRDVVPQQFHGVMNNTLKDELAFWGYKV